MAEPLLLVAGAVAVVALLVCSAFFSSSETAIFTVPEAWVDEQAATGDGRAGVLAGLRDDPHRLLVTLLVGNNLVNVAISSVITVLLVEALPPGPAVVATTLLASSLVLIFGEIVPKSYGLGNARAWSLAVALPLTVVERALYPVVIVFDVVTRRLSAVVSGEPTIEELVLDE